MANIDDQMILGLKNCYGTGTRSYNRSAEKREMDRQRKKVTAEWVPKASDVLVCHCSSFHFPHFLDAHKALKSEYDWSSPHPRNVILWENLK